MSLGQIIIIVVAVLIGLVVLAPIIGLTIGLALTLLVAGLIGWLADRIMPGELPYGKAGAVGAGIVGAVIGSLIPVINDLGPALFGYPRGPGLCRRPDRRGAGRVLRQPPPDARLLQVASSSQSPRSTIYSPDIFAAWGCCQWKVVWSGSPTPPPAGPGCCSY